MTDNLNIEAIKESIKDISRSAIRLDSDMYGNPRYYIPIFSFSDENGEWFRPFNATKYRGKKYGAGWAFQSYNLESSVRRAFEEEYKLELGALA